MPVYTLTYINVSYNQIIVSYFSLIDNSRFNIVGLTCTEANFIQKSGFQKYASELGLIVVNPDTSPRGAGVDGEDESYDLGSGAGFYLDATEEKWKKHYRMYSYVTKEVSFGRYDFCINICK